MRRFNPYSLLVTRADECFREGFLKGFKESLEERGLSLSSEDMDMVAEAEFSRYIREKNSRQPEEYVLNEEELENERITARKNLLERLQESGMLTPEQVDIVQCWKF